MILPQSPLEFVDFSVINTKYNFVFQSEPFDDVKEVFATYQIDFDFSIQLDDLGQYSVFCKVGINNVANPVKGYKLFVETLSVFTISDHVAITEKEKSDLFNISGLSIAINNLRTFITSMTSFFPLGQYVLPAVDLNGLHELKNQQIFANLEKKEMDDVKPTKKMKKTRKKK